MPTTNQTRTDLRAEATRYLYAGVGVADLAVEVVRDAVSSSRKTAADLQKSVAEVKPAAVAASVRDSVAAQVKALPSKVTVLLDENVSAAGGTYDDLAKRGQTLVGRIRKQESTQAAAASTKTTVSKAKTTRTQTRKAASASTTAAKKSATETAVGVKKAATKRSAAAKGTTTTARKRAATARSSAKATATAAQETVAHVADAVVDAAEKVGD